ncbi:MAG: hypothetical protein EBV28_09900 [Betaproteobacteria bacterium]|nr:hypothetical protein [Betaproteobacteria bacterium]
MSWDQAWALLVFEVSLSLLSVGGVIVLASEQHRYLVLEQGWLSEAVAAVLVWRSRMHLLVLLASGAVAGMLLEWRLPLSPA